METILLEKTADGTLTCEVGITVQEWEEMIQDSSILSQNCKNALITLYREPNHTASCTKLALKFYGDPSMAQSYNGWINAFARAVVKRLNRFKIVNENGEKKYWPVPMSVGKEVDGLFEWTMRPELATAIKNLGMDQQFTWIPIYMELADKLLQFKDDRTKLIEILKSLDKEHIEYLKNEDGSMIEDIDPFSVFAIFNRGNTEVNRVDILQKFKELLDMKSELPSDFDSVPVVQAISSMFISKDSETSEIQNLWDIFEAIITKDTESIAHLYDIVQKQKGIKWNLTVGFYWARPYEHISLDSNNRTYLPKIGIEVYEENDYQHYALILNNVLSAIENKKLKEVSIPEISYNAWANKTNLWLVGYAFGGTNSQLDRFKEESIWEGGFDDNKKGNKALELAKQIKPGDILILKSTSTKGTNHDIPFLRIKAVAIVTGDNTLTPKDFGTSLQCPVKYISIEEKEFTGSEYGAFRNTIAKLGSKPQAIFDYINSLSGINATMDMENKEYSKYTKYIDLLKENYNLVLTGAPGTGKTFMAKEIAKEMGAEMAFVQFHPSYDYSDFVEGLRPVEKSDGQMGFVRCDGVFKEFCKKAIKNIEDSNKTTEEIVQEMSLEECYNEVIDKIENGEITDFELKTGGKGMIVDKISENNNIILKTPNSNSDRTYTVSFDRLSKLAKVYTDIKSLDEINNINEAIRGAIGGCNASSYWAVLRAVYEQKKDINITTQSIVEKKPYVFIIDEINRGEASKIFGELFYAIDSGYRGKNDVPLKTQYQNMIPDTDAFSNGFYVPENVYILATMNDIDRSVESMDFAMRRRFTWIEVSPEDTQDMLNTIGEPLASKAKETMARLNAAIAKTDGLGTAYMIGGSYFMRLANNGGDFDRLWTMNLEPLLKEYLRGFRKAGEIMLKFKQAYQGFDNYEDSELSDTANDED